MAMSDGSVCRYCFYRDRTRLTFSCTHNTREKVYTQWNAEEGRHETTERSIRPFISELFPPHLRYVAMCDPYRGTCRKDWCTFAHGRAEQKAWNSNLRERTGGVVNHEQVQIYQAELSYPSSKQPWPDLSQPYQLRPQYLSPNHQQYKYSMSWTLQHPGQGHFTLPQQLPPHQVRYQHHPPGLGQQPRQHISQSQQQGPNWYAAREETFQGRLKGRLNLSEIEVKLSRENYQRKFNNLICWEEKRHIELLRDKCDQDCSLTLFSRGYVPEWVPQQSRHSRNSQRARQLTETHVVKRHGFLSLDTDKVSYATQASEGAFIVSQDEDSPCEVKLEILKDYRHSDEKLYIAFNENDSAKLSQIISRDLSEKYETLHNLTIEFEVKHSYFNTLVKAVNGISSTIINRLLPVPTDFYRLVEYPDECFISLLANIPRDLTIDRKDKDQFCALRKVLTCDRRSPPIIVNGSFGSGKTRLLAVTTHCIIQHGMAHKEPVRVLICAHHQKSADHFIENYFGPMFFRRSDVDLVRITPSNLFFNKDFLEFPQYYWTREEYIHAQKSTLHIPQYLVIVTTFLTAPSLLMIGKFQGVFTHILLDEGSQSREPETIAPLTLASPGTKLVIAGDSKQVGPSLLVLGKEARENGLKHSLLERLQDLYTECGGNALQHMVSLNTNYRCHKDIVKISNELFYESKVKSRPLNASAHPQAEFPLLFVCSSTTLSANYELEAQLLLQQIKKFAVLNWSKQEWGDWDPAEICLVTATQTQLVIARHQARKNFQELKFIRMLTTYNIQGQEFQVLFMSTTEPVDAEGNTTNPTKSPCDPHIFNTILTRSKSLVVVVGNPLALLRIEEHMEVLYDKKAHCWSSYIRLCLENDTFIIPPEVEPKEVTRSEFSSWLKATLLGPETSRIASRLIDSLPLHHVPPVQQIPHPSNTFSRRHGTAATSEQHAFPFATQALQGTEHSAPMRHSSSFPDAPAITSNQQHLQSIFEKQDATSKLQHAFSFNDPESKEIKKSATPMKFPSNHQQFLPSKKQQQLASKQHGSATVSQQQNSSPVKATLHKEQDHHRNVVPPSLTRQSEGQMNSSAINLGEKDFPDLISAKKVSKKEGKRMARKNHHAAAKQSQLSKTCISSPNVAIPTNSSLFYREYIDKLESNSSLLKERLTVDNYKEKFHHLLCWEEQEHIKQLSERCDKEYDVHIFQNHFIPEEFQNEDERDHEDQYIRFGYINSDDGDTLAHAKQASEGSFIVLDNQSYVYAKHVYARIPSMANFNAIVIAFDAEQHGKLMKSGLFNRDVFSFRAKIKFDLKHFYFTLLHKSIKYLPREVIKRLIPVNFVVYSGEYTHHEECPRVITYDKMELDELQVKALNCMLQFSSSLPVLIAGPFGTGKTRLLARLAFEILRESNRRVLICAHHQTSVDTFVDYFGEMQSVQQNVIGMIRVIASNTYWSETRKRHKKFFKVRNMLSPEDFENMRLVITTNNTAAKLFWKVPGDTAELKREFFTDFLLDEGAQAREPEAVGPLSLAGCQARIVIAGDHCQVGPKLLVLGDEAQSNGLGVSLLERLHDAYDKRGHFPAKKFRSLTLLTNHRCHSGILMLPSSLYYGSTLQCGKKNDKPHHLASFPLTFVCSDSEQKVGKVTGASEVEADVLIREVQKYFKTWPKNWSRKDKRICIMSPSPDQCSLLRDKIRNIKLDCVPQVLEAYRIQGNEFPAIFISTTEPTENGQPLNKTKSICDRFVFNTAITRSKLLVVAVGNPFLLINMEENMIRKAGGDPAYRTWSPYIKQCIQCETFSYAKPVKRANPIRFIESTHQLYATIHSENSVQSFESSKPLSSIIKAYKQVFESIQECKDTKLILSNSKDDRLTWSIQNVPPGDLPEEEVHYSDQYLCHLRIDTYRKAEAIPYDSSKRIVKIRGEKHRRGAFDGDMVKVGVFSDNPPDKCYGRVLKVERVERDIKFICRVSSYSPLIFYPIDKKNPKLINLPGLSRVLLRKKKGERVDKSDLETWDVVVFDPKSFDVHDGEEIPLPQISQVIPISIARNMLFLVSYVRWKEKYPYPLGIVIGVYSKGHTPFNAERLLRFVHSVEYNSNNQGGSQSHDVPRDASLHFSDRAFTIDPEEAQNLDDALSIVKVRTDEDGHAVYQLGVHIVNAAKHIQPGTDIDKFTRSKGTSVYGGEKGKIMHMLPDLDTRCMLSLIPGKVRDVISVTCDVTFANAAELHFGKCSIDPAQIRSAVQLTYSDAQRIMDGCSLSHPECVKAMRKFDQDHINPSLKDSMLLLYAIATALRRERLKSDAAFAYDVNSNKEAGCWQSHLLVEELMIWANSEAAKCIHSSFPHFALLRSQAQPNAKEKDETLRKDQGVMKCSLHLSHYLLEQNHLDTPDLDILIPHDTLKQIRKALQERNKTLLVHLLSADRLYPQFAAVCSKFRAISLHAEYCCTDKSEAGVTAYRHDSLCLNEYAHFTSPMRRYIDIEVQRLLLEIGKENSTEDSDNKHKKHTDLCVHLNAKKRSASEYEKKVKNVELAFKFIVSSQVYTAFICQEMKSSIKLSFPDLELSSFPSKAKDLKITTHFLPSVKEEDSDRYVWKLRITSLQSSFAANILQLANLSVVKLHSSNGANMQAYCISNNSLLDTEHYEVSQPSSVVKVPSSIWQQALEFVKLPTEEKMDRVAKILPQVTSLPPSCPVDLTSKKYPFFDFDIKSTLKESDALKVWLTWTMREPVISPAIQLVEVSPLLRVCVQHNSHPAECFSDLNLAQASKEEYDSLGEYVDLWKKVLLAEAAQKSIRESQPNIIQDVVLKWPELVIPEECIEEVYYVPKGSVEMILPVGFVEHCSEFFDIRVGHLICVRYGFNPKKSVVRAVYHFVVHQVTDLKDDNESNATKEKVVSMEPIGKWNCRVSEVMKKELESNPPCEVQVIPLSVSYRKVFMGLLKLGQRKGDKIWPLSQSVAVDRYQTKQESRFYKNAEHIADSDELAKSISKWSSPMTGSMSLNEWQEEAMDKALCKSFQLIQGPPGTGKSVTGAHIAYVFARLNKTLNTADSHQCVLYCGPSNKSVEVVFKKFHDLVTAKTDLNLRILRIYSSAIERKDYPGPQEQRYRKLDAECPEWAKLYALHHLLRQCSSSSKLNEMEQELASMKKEGKIPSGKWSYEYRQVLAEAQKQFLSNKKFDIVFCTCNEAAGVRVNKYMSKGLQEQSIHQCIIDECGMAYEPETIVPIGLCEHAVLIGDHMQLQPVIDYQQAKENGLSTSLFERYARYYEEEGYIFTLKTQYRMHKAICAFPSEEFYDDKLTTAPSVLNRSPKDNLKTFWPKGNELPIMFVDVVGKEGLDKIRSGKDDNKVGIESKYNQIEAHSVIEIARTLLVQYGVPVQDIAILTPYSAQKAKLHKMVKDLPAEFHELKVASVTESQGDEYGIVILSTVRSLPLDEIRHKHFVQPDHQWKREHLGFIADRHQINVGITRSKCGLIITGNKTLLGYDSTWERLLQHYDERGCVVDASRYPVTH